MLNYRLWIGIITPCQCLCKVGIFNRHPFESGNDFRCSCFLRYGVCLETGFDLNRQTVKALFHLPCEDIFAKVLLLSINVSPLRCKIFSILPITWSVFSVPWLCLHFYWLVLVIFTLLIKGLKIFWTSCSVSFAPAANRREKSEHRIRYLHSTDEFTTCEEAVANL